MWIAYFLFTEPGRYCIEVTGGFYTTFDGLEHIHPTDDLVCLERIGRFWKELAESQVLAQGHSQTQRE